MRRHGLRNTTQNPRCSCCDAPLKAECIGVPIERQSTDAGDAVQCEELFHCLSCGAFLECRMCCLKRHEPQLLMACLQVWRDATWQTISLREIGLVYQLGHQGARCPVPDATPHIMTVMHVNGVHQVEMRYCDCTSSLSDGEHRRQQLLRSGLYPATPRYPDTCVTIDILNLYRRLQTVE
ncbi:hypothetical protein BDZ89DRAFT_971636 [Hymenopellis radicata]|nr:hypothetical protein BDZ89DRAFT_971636 [Hymenopellis radicata]